LVEIIVRQGHRQRVLGFVPVADRVDEGVAAAPDLLRQDVKNKVISIIYDGHEPIWLQLGYS
jgi:hypothetical protein